MNLIYNNSFQILGLDSDASQRDILKRAKELGNFIKIDEDRHYDSEIPAFIQSRSESLIKESLQNLTDPKKKIVQYFFNFNIKDSVDEEAVELIKEGNYTKAINLWKSKSADDGTKSLLYKRNLAVLYTGLLYLGEQYREYLDSAVECWSEINKSKKFWDAFVKLYKVDDDLSTNQDIVDKFVNNFPSCLSDIFTDLQQKYKDSAFIASFSQAFETTGGKLEKDVLNPAFREITITLSRLEELSSDTYTGAIDEAFYQEVKDAILKIQGDLNKLVELGLFDKSETRVMRDKIANTIRSVVLKIYNNQRETDKSIALIKIAIKIAGTAGLESRLKQEIETLEQNKKNDEITAPITNLINSERYTAALELISETEKTASNPELAEFFTNQRKMCITAMAAEKYKTANDYFKAGNYDAAKELFGQIVNLITENINIFNFNAEAVNSLIDSVKQQMATVNSKNLEQVDNLRSEIRKLADEKFKDYFESPILVFLMDSLIYFHFIDFLKKYRQKSQIANVFYYVAFFVFFWQWWLGILIAVGTYIYKNHEK